MSELEVEKAYIIPVCSLEDQGCGADQEHGLDPSEGDGTYACISCEHTCISWAELKLHISRSHNYPELSSDGPAPCVINVKEEILENDTATNLGSGSSDEAGGDDVSTEEEIVENDTNTELEKCFEETLKSFSIKQEVVEDENCEPRSLEEEPLDDSGAEGGKEPTGGSDAETALGRILEDTLDSFFTKEKTFQNENDKPLPTGKDATPKRNRKVNRRSQSGGRRPSRKSPTVTTVKSEEHACPHCAYKTVWSSHLKRHINNVHVAPKTRPPQVPKMPVVLGAVPSADWACSECGYRTDSAKHLKRHVNSVHAGERPHACVECDYRALEARNLRRHVRYKHPKPGDAPVKRKRERKYLCAHCPYSGLQLRSLRTHLLSVHEPNPSKAQSRKRQSCDTPKGNALVVPKQTQDVTNEEDEMQLNGQSSGHSKRLKPNTLASSDDHSVLIGKTPNPICVKKEIIDEDHIASGVSVKEEIDEDVTSPPSETGDANVFVKMTPKRVFIKEEVCDDESDGNGRASESYASEEEPIAVGTLRTEVRKNLKRHTKLRWDFEAKEQSNDESLKSHFCQKEIQEHQTQKNGQTARRSKLLNPQIPFLYDISTTVKTEKFFTEESSNAIFIKEEVSEDESATGKENSCALEEEAIVLRTEDKQSNDKSLGSKSGSTHFRQKEIREHKTQNNGQTSRRSKRLPPTVSFSDNSTKDNAHQFFIEDAPNVIFIKEEVNDDDNTTPSSSEKGKRSRKETRRSKNKSILLSEDHSCPHCVYTTDSAKHLKRHINYAHAEDKPHACDQCSYRSNDAHNLKRHVKYSHSGQRFECAHCPYASKRLAYLRTHIVSKHVVWAEGGGAKKERRHQCAHCEYRARYAGRLRAHVMSKHTSEKPYSCSMCPYKAVEATSLKLHVMSRHAVSKPYVCKYCDYSTVLPRYLEWHVRAIHTKEKPYTCSLCSYSAAHPCNMKRHFRYKHSHEKLHTCGVCGAGFVEVTHMRNHMLRKHPES